MMTRPTAVMPWLPTRAHCEPTIETRAPTTSQLTPANAARTSPAESGVRRKSRRSASMWAMTSRRHSATSTELDSPSAAVAAPAKVSKRQVRSESSAWPLDSGSTRNSRKKAPTSATWTRSGGKDAHTCARNAWPSPSSSCSGRSQIARNRSPTRAAPQQSSDVCAASAVSPGPRKSTSGMAAAPMTRTASTTGAPAPVVAGLRWSTANSSTATTNRNAKLRRSRAKVRSVQSDRGWTTRSLQSSEFLENQSKSTASDADRDACRPTSASGTSESHATLRTRSGRDATSDRWGDGALSTMHRR